MRCSCETNDDCWSWVYVKFPNSHTGYSVTYNRIDLWTHVDAIVTNQMIRGRGEYYVDIRSCDKFYPYERAKIYKIKFSQEHQYS